MIDRGYKNHRRQLAQQGSATRHRSAGVAASAFLMRINTYHYLVKKSGFNANASVGKFVFVTGRDLPAAGCVRDRLNLDIGAALYGK